MAETIAPASKWRIFMAAVVIAAALVVAYYVGQSKQLQHLSETVRAHEKAVKQNAVTAIYSLSNETSKIFVQYPEVRGYFYREDRGKKGMSDDELRRAFDAEDPIKRARIRACCEMLADFMQQALEQHDLLSGDDWNTWWNYFMDAWDESPILRDYFNDRTYWYIVDEALRPLDATGKPITDHTLEGTRDKQQTDSHRAKYYKGTNNRRF